MKIVAMSDLHGHLTQKPLPDGDVLIIAGDICPDFRPTEKQSVWAQQELQIWLRHKKKQFRNIILTWGNHDFVDSYGKPTASRMDALVNEFDEGPPDSYVYICDSPQTIKLGKYLFYVNPYCLQLPGWAYQTSEECLADMYRDIPLGVDVIVSHGPPLDYCDKLSRTPGFHAGSIALKNAVRKSQPQAVICGHIHEAFGKYELQHVGKSERTLIYNVSQMDLEYHYHHRPVEFEIS